MCHCNTDSTNTLGSSFGVIPWTRDRFHCNRANLCAALQTMSRCCCSAGPRKTVGGIQIRSLFAYNWTGSLPAEALTSTHALRSPTGRDGNLREEQLVQTLPPLVRGHDTSTEGLVPGTDSAAHPVHVNTHQMLRGGITLRLRTTDSECRPLWTTHGAQQDPLHRETHFRSSPPLTGRGNRNTPST